MSSADSTGVEMYCNVVQVANSSYEQAIAVGASNRGTVTNQPFLGQQQVSVNNNVHHNTVFWDLGANGSVGYSQLDPTNQPSFFALNTPPDYNQYHISNTNLGVFIYDNNNSGTNARKTFAQYQAAGADTHGTIDTNYTSTYPTVTITSPSDGATVSGSVNINANASDSGSSVSKVEFYRDWTLLGTDSMPPYSMSWNTTGMASGKHTLAAMAYNANGIRTCYGVTVYIP